MTELLRAQPWIEPGLYVECPHCGDANLIESGHGVDLPDDDFRTTCDLCDIEFIVSGKGS